MNSVTELKERLTDQMKAHGVNSKLVFELNPVVPWPLIKMNNPELPYYSGYIPEGIIFDWDQYFEGILQLPALELNISRTGCFIFSRICSPMVLSRAFCLIKQFSAIAWLSLF